MARDIELNFENSDNHPSELRRRLKASAAHAAEQEKWHLAAILYRAIAELDLEKVIADSNGDAAWNAHTAGIHPIVQPRTAQDGVRGPTGDGNADLAALQLEAHRQKGRAESAARFNQAMAAGCMCEWRDDRYGYMVRTGFDQACKVHVMTDPVAKLEG